MTILASYAPTKMASGDWWAIPGLPHARPMTWQREIYSGRAGTGWSREGRRRSHTGQRGHPWPQVTRADGSDDAKEGLHPRNRVFLIFLHNILMIHLTYADDML